MKSLTDGFVLPNGVSIPCIGLGTAQAPDGEEAVRAVRDAIACGYRHIDTAAGYGNERSVGLAARESGVAREELFITSKLGNSSHGYEDTLAAFETTMTNLGLAYLDLYLIHWPNPLKYRDCWQSANAGTWKAMEELHKAGRIRAIGISNFMPHHIEELMKTATVKPMVNQVRLCPGEVQEKTAPYCKEHGILLEAYSPLGTGRIFDVPQMQELAAKYGKSIAQICVRWCLQNGWLPLPKSVNAARIKKNAEVFDFELSAEDVSLISGLTGVCGPTTDPDLMGA